MAAAKNDAIDESRYSRQIYALGLGAMRRMMSATVAVVGLNPAGAETAKNVCLSGCKALHLFDARPVGRAAAAANCFMCVDGIDFAANRAKAHVAPIAALNPGVSVLAHDAFPTDAAAFQAHGIDLVLFSNASDYMPRTALNALCGALHDARVMVITLDVYGVFCRLFNDFGEKFRVLEPTGEDATKQLVTEVAVESAATRTEDLDRREFDIKAARTRPEEVAAAAKREKRVFVATLRVDTSESELLSVEGGRVKVEITDGGDAPPCPPGLFGVQRREGEDKLDVWVDGDDAAAAQHRDLLSRLANPVPGQTLSAYLTAQVTPIDLSFMSLPAAEAAGLPQMGERCVESQMYLDPTEREALFQAMFRFQEGKKGAQGSSEEDCEWSSFPRPKVYDDAEAAALVALCPEGAVDMIYQKPVPDKAVATAFAKTARADTVGVAAFAGGVTAQEVLKGVSAKFKPAFQFWHYDFREVFMRPKPLDPQSNAIVDVAEEVVLPEDAVPLVDPAARTAPYQLLYGQKGLANIHNSTVFVIGAGALGCEYVKNFAVAGVAQGPRGSVTLTDNDSIEKSNLCRQFLFREQHIGQNKCLVAAGVATKQLNKGMKIRALTDKVWSETSDPVTGIFNNRFWKQQQLVCTAVDNIAARHFLDNMCVEYRIPMVDSGTQGARGHVEVFAPHATGKLQDGGAQADTKKIPFCSVHYFPTSIDHCVQYASDFFSHNFSGAPTDANKFLSAASPDEFLATVEAGAKHIVIDALYGTLVENKPATFADCVSWARVLFEVTFVQNIRQLLHNYPADKVDDDGKPYYGGSRKIPHVPSFFAADNATLPPNALYFVAHAALLFAQMHNLPGIPANFEAACAATAPLVAADAAAKIELPPFVPSKLTIPDNSDKKEKKEQHVDANDEATAAEAKRRDEERARRTDGQFKALCERYFGPESDATTTRAQLTATTFEKDDDANGHVRLIAAIANVRAATYSIPQESEMQCKKIAGRIVPAMITTTAAVTGLATIQSLTLLALGTDAASGKNFPAHVAVPAAAAANDAASKTTLRDVVLQNCRSTAGGVNDLDGLQQFQVSMVKRKPFFARRTEFELHQALTEAPPPMAAMAAPASSAAAAAPPAAGDDDGAHFLAPTDPATLKQWQSHWFTTWSRLEVSGPEMMKIRDVLAAVAEQYHGLVVETLVEARTAKVIFDAEADDASVRDFPLVLWTCKWIGMDDADASARGQFDFIVRARRPDALPVELKVADSLPLLRFTIAKAKKKKAVAAA